jgi:hypothetical protein
MYYQLFRYNNVNTRFHLSFHPEMIVQCSIVRLNVVYFQRKSSLFLAPSNVQTQVNNVMEHNDIKIV